MGIALTDAKKQIATQLYASGNLTVSDIARQIGVSQGTLSVWINKQPWYVPRYDLRSAKVREARAKAINRADPILANKGVPEGSFIIPGVLPGLNEYITAINSSRHQGNKLKGDTEEYIVSCIRAGLTNTKPYDCKVHIHIRFYEKDKKRDYDNITSGTKFILDALRKAGVIYNDGQSFLFPSTFEYDVDTENPRVHVFIHPTDNKLPERLIKGTAVHKVNNLRYMSDGEIIRAYNTSSNKKEQIKILAQLNAMSKDEIRMIVEGKS
jgi:Holliday junction resolvase RusA-like endonuclease